MRATYIRAAPSASRLGIVSGDIVLPREAVLRRASVLPRPREQKRDFVTPKALLLLPEDAYPSEKL